MSTKQESAFKLELVSRIRKVPNAYARRVEDKIAVGVLDLIIKLPEWPWMFAEGKYLAGGFLFAPTRKQFEEGEKLLATGAPVFLIGWKRAAGKFTKMYLTTWREEADIRECFEGPGTESTCLETFYNFLTDPAWPLLPSLPIPVIPPLRMTP